MKILSKHSLDKINAALVELYHVAKSDPYATRYIRATNAICTIGAELGFSAADVICLSDRSLWSKATQDRLHSHK